jgi:transcription antitermination factor NusG
MSAPEVAVIPMEGHAMLIALGVLEERVVEAEDHEAMDEEEEEAMYHDDEEDKAEASVEAEVEAEAETEVKSEVEVLSDVVAELKAQMEELKEERAAMKVHTPDNKATKLDWKEVAIQNALKFKK